MFDQTIFVYKLIDFTNYYEAIFIMTLLHNFKTHCSFQSVVLMCYHRSSRVGSLRKSVAESQWT